MCRAAVKKSVWRPGADISIIKYMHVFEHTHKQAQQIYTHTHTHTHTQVATPTRLLFLCVLISAISGGYSYLRTRTHIPLCGSLFSSLSLSLSLWNALFCRTHMAADWP